MAESKCHFTSIVFSLLTIFSANMLLHSLQALSINNSAVCNCHSDNRLAEMLELVHNGYRCSRKTDLERLNFAAQLRNALEDFTGKFIPHMQEEEEVFQPLLMKYFSVDELRQMKNVVLSRHRLWGEQLEHRRWVSKLSVLLNSASFPGDLNSIIHKYSKVFVCLSTKVLR